MKFSFKILAILLYPFIGGFKSFTNPIHIKGHLNSRNSFDVSILTVFVKGDDNILAKAITTKNGNFEVTFTPKNEISFDFYCTGVGIDTLLIESLRSFESDESRIAFDVPRKIKFDKSHKVICPKCEKADKVYKIVYSFSPVYTRVVNGFGDTSYSPIYKGTYQENCTAKPAKYFCDRDKVKF